MTDSSTIRIKGIDIRQRIIGDGPPVLMIHGWGANIDLLQPLALPLSRLGYRCYMPDLPGFGASADPPEPFTIFDYADFCLAYIDHHDLPTVNYFGHSLGGRIGLILGAEYANRLEKMTLSNSAGIRVDPPLHNRLRLRLYQNIRDGLSVIGAKAISDRLRNIYSQRYGSADYLSASPVMQKTLVNVVNQDLLAYAERVPLPTILIWGDEDRDTPLWMGQKLERAIPDAALIVHESAGHYAYLDFPEKTASIMHALFAGQ
ncbi:MAG: alpha/beta hydrolase [Chloroflexi bacterium]|nr:alpha/beta hydrolase [Chloroflexota bacterium]